ncbi:diphthamide biosynthesis protein [Acaromyces ingoldii]|uniref:2-(3-amino-3-carboxypropyl)histidine synthase subunit 2 n=1 Tax=Acaromyces ingoldii TaxID=215250 RepID=A0A316YSM8_9BASI|nr:diphthamide biosynthesis protein [Acaromyces ingoldii]PWN92309.1 diphthamide biosynthesis protein [Acaromyces ingoldii]
MTTAPPLSAPDAAIINHVVPLDETVLNSTSRASGISITELYDLNSVVETIVPAAASEPRFRRVALQLPDELLCDASAIFWELQRRIKQALSASTSSNLARSPELFVLADTSYGNCCVDEVAASHVDADLVVHFGHACLSPTARLPVLYVFSRLPIDVRHAAKELMRAVEEEEGSKNVVLMYDIAYEHAAPEVFELLRCGKEPADRFVLAMLDKHSNFTRHASPNPTGWGGDGVLEEGMERIKLEERNCGHDGCSTDRCASSLHSATSSSSPSNHKFILPPHIDVSHSLVLYLGGESLALTNLLLHLGPSTSVHSYDPLQDRLRVETGATNKLLMRRYAAVQRARDASVVALVVGTLGVHSYLPLLASLKELLTKKHGRKVYTISVGKLSPAKLANFQEVDIFVLVACPENSLVELKGTGKDYYKPIVTPWEMQIALDGGRGWSGEYILELGKVLEEGERQKQGADDAEGEDEPHFSLVTGGFVSRRHRPNMEGESEEQQAGTVALRSNDGIVTKIMDSAGGAHVAGRSWRGLEQRLGMDEPAKLEVGRAGIAQGYADGDEARHEGATN